MSARGEKKGPRREWKGGGAQRKKEGKKWVIKDKIF